MTTVIIADSRGKDIKRLLNLFMDARKIGVLTYSGADIAKATQRALPIVRSVRPALVIIMAGICNFTVKSKTSRKVETKYKSEYDTVNHVIEEIRTAYKSLAGLDYNMIITVATITGMDIADYNNANRKYMTDDEYRCYTNTTKIAHPYQTMLNNAILATNRMIVQLNENTQTPTAWIAGVVHPHFRGKNHHQYIRLQDGCHGSERTKTKWAETLAKIITKVHRSIQDQD